MDKGYFLVVSVILALASILFFWLNRLRSAPRVAENNFATNKETISIEKAREAEMDRVIKQIGKGDQIFWMLIAALESSDKKEKLKVSRYSNWNGAYRIAINLVTPTGISDKIVTISFDNRRPKNRQILVGGEIIYKILSKESGFSLKDGTRWIKDGLIPVIFG